MKQLNAFHGDHKIKEKYLARVKAHRLADEIIHGKYWENGKGCAVGCTIHSGRHESYEPELGIQTVIAVIEDFLFERLKNGAALNWPERFLDSIQVGADLSHVYGKFFAWTLLDKQVGFWKVWKSKEDQQIFIDFGNFISFLATDQPFNKKQWDSVRVPFTSCLSSLDSLDSLDRLASLDSFASLDRLASLARLARLASLARRDGLARLASLSSLSSLDRLASLSSLDSLDRLASLDRLDRLASLSSLSSLDRLASLSSLDLYQIAADKLIELLKEAPVRELEKV